MRIILIGMKGCGKTIVGALLAKKMQISFIDSDAIIETMHAQDSGESISFRQIFKEYGEEYFNALDTRALNHIANEFANGDFVLACAGRTPLQDENQEILLGLGKIIFLNVERSVLLKRILAQGTPAFFSYQDDPERSFNELVAKRLPVYKKLADMTLDIGEETIEEVVHSILTELISNDKD